MIYSRFLLLLTAALALSTFATEAVSTNELVSAVECRERGGLPNVLAKLKAGGEVRIAYLGGSITAQEGWRPLTLSWFRHEFPTAKVSEINAAIGGTGSDLGVFRLKHDVLEHHPDLLFVEFAVNDTGAPTQRIYRSMEGIVRQVWKYDPTIDICFVYTIRESMLETLQQGLFPPSASAMEKVADYYGIPSINMGLGVARLEKAGKLVFKGDKPQTEAEKTALGDKILFSADGVHPYTDTGHQLYLEAVVRSFGLIREAGTPGPHPLPGPFVADNWEAAKMVPLSKVNLSSGWRQLDTRTNSIAKAFIKSLPEVWKASQPGDSMSFTFRGSTARIYDIMGPDCGQIMITLDEKKPRLVAMFDGFSTYHRLATITIGEGMPPALHTVKITICPDQPDKEHILNKNHKEMDDPKRYEGTAFYAGAVLIIGDLVE